MHIPALKDYNTRHIITSEVTQTTTTKSWVCPEGVHQVSVYLIGGGGGGSRTSGTAGGAGGTIHAIQRVVPGETYTLVAGKGGRGGLFVGPYELPGDPSYFKYSGTNLLVGYGGHEGYYSSSTAAAGGSGDLLDSPLKNISYTIKNGDSSSTTQGANGADNLWASGGLGSVGGGAPGGGGAGYQDGGDSNNGANGGDGGNGGVIIEYSLDYQVTDYVPA
jgi:hypothetical protein